MGAVVGETGRRRRVHIVIQIWRDPIVVGYRSIREVCLQLLQRCIVLSPPVLRGRVVAAIGRGKKYSGIVFCAVGISVATVVLVCSVPEFSCKTAQRDSVMIFCYWLIVGYINVNILLMCSPYLP